MKNFNTKQQGNVGIGKCISWATQLGYTVCIPLNDSQNYDLVVEINNKLLKIQVKTSRYKNKYGKYIVDLRSTSIYTNKNFDSSTVDYVFITTEDNSCYLIPSCEVITKTAITINSESEKYKLAVN